MKYFLRALLCALAFMGLAQLAPAAEAPPPTQGPVYVTTFYEVSPGSAAQAITALKDYRDVARKEPGGGQLRGLAGGRRPSRFANDEVLARLAAYDAHA